MRLSYPDPRNHDIVAWIGRPNDRCALVPREHAKISVFDSSVQGGDAAWEGIRVYRGKVFKLDRHIRRLHDSARALAFEGVHTADQVRGRGAHCAGCGGGVRGWGAHCAGAGAGCGGGVQGRGACARAHTCAYLPRHTGPCRARPTA
jgi:hypothetical protein